MPNSIPFYSVRQRRTVQVPRDQVSRAAYHHRDNVTYAFRAVLDGEPLTRFVTRAQYDML